MAKKDAYYFSHDSNAQDDPKCMLLIDQLGMEGYGIFWALIERLRNEKDYKLPVVLINALAKRWYTSKEKVESVVKNYGLFVVESDFFFSERLKNSMNEKSAKASLSASYRWGNATALLPDSDRSANGMQNDANKGKESKVKEKKESKVKESINLHFDSDVFKNAWDGWKAYKKSEHKFSYKSQASEQAGLKHLVDISGGDEKKAISIIQQSLCNGWKGLFELKNNFSIKINHTNGQDATHIVGKTIEFDRA